MAHLFILDVYVRPNRKYVNLSLIYYVLDFSFFLSQDDAYFHIHQNDPTVKQFFETFVLPQTNANSCLDLDRRHGDCHWLRARHIAGKDVKTTTNNLDPSGNLPWWCWTGPVIQPVLCVPQHRHEDGLQGETQRCRLWPSFCCRASPARWDMVKSSTREHHYAAGHAEQLLAATVSNARDHSQMMSS